MATEKAKKDFFGGDFNWAGETYHFFRDAQNEDHAWQIMTRALAKEVKRSVRSLRFEFDGQRKDNYKIFQTKRKARGVLKLGKSKR